MRLTNRLSFSYWGKWVGLYYTNYDYYQGDKPPRWSGFHLGLGFSTLMYHLPRHLLEA